LDLTFSVVHVIIKPYRFSATICGAGAGLLVHKDAAMALAVQRKKEAALKGVTLSLERTFCTPAEVFVLTHSGFNWPGCVFFSGGRG
jgi:hypothetical protein